MDELAHALWAYGILNKSRHPWLVILFAVLPDIIIFAPLMIYGLITKSFQFGPPDTSKIPPIVFIGYNITHSFITVALVFLVIYLVRKKIYLFLYAWPIHILLDIPTHTKEFFPTVFLYPLSGFYVDGISWASKWFMALNYSLLALLFIFILGKKYMEKHKRSREKKNKFK